MYLCQNFSLREKLERGETAIGFQLRSHHAGIAEMIGWCGFDFIYVDTEHHPANDETLMHVLRAAELAGTVPLLRIPTLDEGRILQFLDMGMPGLILPHVDTPEQAKSIVRAGKFHPLGLRGASYDSRAANYGFVDKEEYRESINRHTLLIPMIESVESVENIDGILDSGIDMIRIGLNDLAESMGLGADPENEAVQKAATHVLARAKLRDIPVGVSAGTVAMVKKRAAEGYRFISYCSDFVLLRRHMMADLGTIRASLQE